MKRALTFLLALFPTTAAAQQGAILYERAVKYEFEVPDRLPVTTHHVMPYFLDKYMNGISNEAFFDTFDFDAIHWTSPFKANTTQHQQWQGLTSTDGTKIFDTPDWQVTVEDVTGWGYVTRRWFFTTPRGQLTMETQSNEHTTTVRANVCAT